MARVSTRSFLFFRLSPAEEQQHKCYLLRQGEIIKRIDAYSNQSKFKQLMQKIYGAGYPVQIIQNISNDIFSGSTPLAKGNAYVEPPNGIRFLRSGEITEDGEVTSTSEIHITEEIHNGLLRRSQLNFGDVLIAIVGATIGNVGVYESNEPSSINQAIAVVRLRNQEILPKYLCYYLKSGIGQGLLDFFKRPVARANINLEEISEIPVLIPPYIIQSDLVSSMDEARSQRKQKLAEADALLSSLDDYLLKILGLEPPVKDERKVFAISLQDVKSQGRLNSDYFHPERILALRAMITAAETINCEKLESIVDFVREKIKKPSENYLGLAHVQSNTGELTNVDDMATGDCFTFQTDDVLFARLRPYLNKVYCAEMDGCCSPEFHVLRIYDKNLILPNYLAVILRSRLILAQTIHMMTGNTHPRLTNDDVTNLLIPIPKIETQEEISQEVQRRRSEAQRLRSEAESGWQAAKQWFEDQLLGGS